MGLWYIMMRDLFFSLICSYLLGSIAFGYIFIKLCGGGDLRDQGSGNIGSTNALRIGGKKIAIATLLADAAKGFVAIMIGKLVQSHCPPISWNISAEFIIFLHGFLAIIGHIFPIFLHFRGGKGVATFAGVLLAFSPILGLVFIISWLVVAFISQYSSLAALISVWLCCDAAAITYNSASLSALFICTALIVTFCHRSNISRLIARDEPKIRTKSNANK